MIKAIIFDFGNVICRFTNELFVARIAVLMGKDIEETRSLIYKKSNITNEFEMGLLESKEFAEALSNLCGLKVSEQKLKKIYTENKYTPIEGMESLISSLLGKYKVGLLTNTSEWDFEEALKVSPIINKFEAITTSFEVKTMKPNRKIYLDILEKLKLAPEECFYVDDLIENVEAAKKVGLKAVQFLGIDKFVDDLKTEGVAI